MMFEKARLFEDEEMAEQILGTEDPGKAKALGRSVRAFDEVIWHANRVGIVVNANLAKFEAHPRLKDFLVTTGTRVLVETSPIDPIWGIGLDANDPRALDPVQWPGTNLLGFALMQVREVLKRS